MAAGAITAASEGDHADRPMQSQRPQGWKQEAEETQEMQPEKDVAQSCQL